MKDTKEGLRAILMQMPDRGGKMNTRRLTWKEISEDIEKGILKECPHCNGYGSSLKEEAVICTVCGGSGVSQSKEMCHARTRNV